jgi:hypothetical protein
VKSTKTCFDKNIEDFLFKIKRYLKIKKLKIDYDKNEQKDNV